LAGNYLEFFTVSPDGVQLYARCYQGPAGAVPVVCLPGLTRNSRDFEALAQWLAESRRVVCPDFRGRGRSGRADPASYRPDQELTDTLQILDELGIGRVAIVGTSRGGIVALAMAARALGRIAGVCFNDIGPRIDRQGLIRISRYLGAESRFQDWQEAVANLKRTTPGFECLTEAQWHVFARRVYAEAGGAPRADYDPGLAANFPSVETIGAGKIPETWGLFDLLAGVPCLVLRGEHSDLLSAATVAEMKQRHPGLIATTVAGRGHVPFLDEPESLAGIMEWLGQIDARPA
jgi:pimeloyl-ACP methyl ester carboxylesterase